MTKRRILAFMLVIALVMVVISACTKEEAPVTEEKTSEVKTETKAADEPKADPLKLTVELFDRNNAPEGQGSLTDNKWTNLIKKEMLETRNVEVEFVPVPRGEETEKLNILMGSGSAPDICFTYTRLVFTDYATQGGLTPLGDLLEEYGPSIIEKKKEAGILDYGTIDDVLYAIPSTRPSQYDRVDYIRKDWLDKLGEPVPKTRDELTRVLLRFAHEDPGNVGENLAVLGQFPNDAYAWGSMFKTGWWNWQYSFMKHSEEDYYCVPLALRDGHKQYLQWLNMLYLEGAIAESWGTESWSEKKQQNANGYTGVVNWGTTSFSSGDLYTTMQENVEGAEWVAFNAFNNDYDGKYYHRAYEPIGLYCFVPATCESPEAAIMYLDYLCEDEIIWTLAYGEEGVQYNLENNMPVTIDSDYSAKTLSWVSGDLNLMFARPSSVDASMENSILAAKYASLGFEDFMLNTLEVASVDLLEMQSYPMPLDVYSDHADELSKAYDEYFVKLVKAKDEAEFEANWTEYMTELEKRGISEVQAEMTKVYNDYVKD